MAKNIRWTWFKFISWLSTMLMDNKTKQIRPVHVTVEIDIGLRQKKSNVIVVSYKILIRLRAFPYFISTIFVGDIPIFFWFCCFVYIVLTFEIEHFISFFSRAANTHSQLIADSIKWTWNATSPVEKCLEKYPYLYELCTLRPTFNTTHHPIKTRRHSLHECIS